VVGPRASEAPFATDVAIDTGVAGIHEAGVAYRMDDVPLPVDRLVPGPAEAATIIRSIAAALAKVARR
jgi:formylmethanofuran dehydrogenase subunit B